MSRFAGLKQTAAAKAAPALAAVPDAPRSGIAKARENKKLVSALNEASKMPETVVVAETVNPVLDIRNS